MSLADYADLLAQPAWMRDAACRDMDSAIFFPARTRPVSRAARKICEGCAVREPCLDYALSFAAHYDFGIYAGTNAQERRVLRRARNAA